MTTLRSWAALAVLVLCVPVSAVAQQDETYDYWKPQRDMIRRGQQAVFMCNGLFTGGRTIENVFAQELAFLPEPVGTPSGGDYVVNETRNAARMTGTPLSAPIATAFRVSLTT